MIAWLCKKKDVRCGGDAFSAPSEPRPQEGTEYALQAWECSKSYIVNSALVYDFWPYYMLYQYIYSTVLHNAQRHSGDSDPCIAIDDPRLQGSAKNNMEHLHTSNACASPNTLNFTLSANEPMSWR